MGEKISFDKVMASQVYECALLGLHYMNTQYREMKPTPLEVEAAKVLDAHHKAVRAFEDIISGQLSTTPYAAASDIQKKIRERNLEGSPER